MKLPPFTSSPLLFSGDRPAKRTRFESPDRNSSGSSTGDSAPDRASTPKPPHVIDQYSLPKYLKQMTKFMKQQDEKAVKEQAADPETLADTRSERVMEKALKKLTAEVKEQLEYAQRSNEEQQRKHEEAIANFNPKNPWNLPDTPEYRDPGRFN